MPWDDDQGDPADPEVRKAWYRANWERQGRPPEPLPTDPEYLAQLLEIAAVCLVRPDRAVFTREEILAEVREMEPRIAEPDFDAALAVSDALRPVPGGYFFV